MKDDLEPSKFQFGLNMMQARRLEKWAKRQVEKGSQRRTDSFGFRFEYRFSPSGTGDNITVYDHFTKDEIILTIDDDGEFLFDENGKQTW